MIKKAIPMLLLLAIACSGPKQGQDESNSSNSIKPVEELSYREIVASVMSEHGEPLEYHGEPTKEEGLEDVTIITGEESCGKSNCGKSFYIKNNGSKTVKALTYSTFQVGSYDSYAARYFTLNSGEMREIGCSHFCYDGKDYLFDHKIIGAEYLQ